MRYLLTLGVWKDQQKVKNAAFADPECGEKSAAKANYDFADSECGERSAAKANYDFADSECGEKSAAKANYDFADLNGIRSQQSVSADVLADQ